MNDRERRDLALVALGAGDANGRGSMTVQAPDDPEYRESLEVTAWIGRAIAPSPTPEGANPPPKSIPRRRLLPKITRTTAAMILAGVLVTTGGAFAAWTYLVGHPLLADDFSKAWFDSRKWSPPPEAIKEGGVRAEKGHLRLVNRGYLVPVREFEDPIQIDLEWKWNQLGLNPLYAEHLTIALRTSGKPSAFPHEVQDGILVKFNAWGGVVRIETPEGKVLASTALSEAPRTIPMPAEQWHRLRVSDDGKTIRVGFAAEDKPEVELDSILLTYEPTEKLVGKKFAIYNRELVSFPHESCIRKLVVQKPK